MSLHTRTICDGCNEEMPVLTHGQMKGKIDFYGEPGELRHFHSPRCLAEYASKLTHAEVNLPKFTIQNVEVTHTAKDEPKIDWGQDVIDILRKLEQGRHIFTDHQLFGLLRSNGLIDALVDGRDYYTISDKGCAVLAEQDK